MQTLKESSTVLDPLFEILNADGFIGFIQGRKGEGKTDVSLLLAEICYLKGYRTHIATNIKTESYMVEAQITNIPDLKAWLQKPGRKLFILDEAGKHLRRMSFMSKKNQAIMELVQLIRHFDCGLIAICPAERFVDSGYLDPGIIDFIIKKYTKAFAKCYLVQANSIIELVTVPRTSISFDSKDIADFSLDKKVSFQGLPRCCQVASLYAEHQSYDYIENVMKLDHQTVRRELVKHCRHSVTSDTELHGGYASMKTDSESKKHGDLT